MVKLHELTAYLDEYLDIGVGNDTSWNGLQVEGKHEVTTVAAAVDAGMETFRQAAAHRADFVLVHHGLFWEFDPVRDPVPPGPADASAYLISNGVDNPSLAGWRAKRVNLLRQHAMSLYTAHLPLDRHAELGNNAQLLQLLGVKRTGDFLIRDGMSISGIGEPPAPLSLSAIEETLSNELGAVCTTLPFGPKTIRRVAVASGHGGYSGFYEALAANADLYITGDTCEVYQTARDAGMNVIFAGHYATETLGVKAVAKHLAKQFDLTTHFIDLPTGL